MFIKKNLPLENFLMISLENPILGRPGEKMQFLAISGRAGHGKSQDFTSLRDPGTFNAVHTLIVRLFGPVGGDGPITATIGVRTAVSSRQWLPGGKKPAGTAPAQKRFCPGNGHGHEMVLHFWAVHIFSGVPNVLLRKGTRKSSIF